MTPPAVPGAATSFSERLRERRRASGKSQADLAGADLSPSYVSLLEAGKRTPTLDVVGALAGRLDCTVEYLLRGEDPAAAERLALTLRYSELALQNGEAQDALTQIDELLRDVSAAPADMVLRARHLKAKAREALGDLEAAIADLEILARDANDGGRVEEHLRLTIDLVRCYQEAGDVAYALDIGRTALDQVERLGMTGSDVHAELVSTVVGAYYVRGDLVKAGMLAERAVHDVEHRGSARARAAVYWNASLVAESADRISDALILAERAVALYAEGDDARAIARLRIAYGWLLLRSTPPQGRRARDVLQQAHASLVDVGSEIDLAYCETELGRAALVIGRPEEALTFAGEAAQRLAGAVRLESAYTELVRARALLLLDRQDEAVAGYRAAAQMLGSLDVSRLAAAAWRELADAFAQLDLLNDAAMAYQQALTEAGVRAAPDVTYQRAAASDQAGGAAHDVPASARDEPGVGRRRGGRG